MATKGIQNKKLYIDIRYHGRRIVKSSGLEDTPENRETLQKRVDHQKGKIDKGKLTIAKAFPGGSEKAFHARLEG